MNKFISLFFLSLCVVTIVSIQRVGAANEPKSSHESMLDQEQEVLFQTKIRPLLMKYCHDCHAPGNMKDIDFLTAESVSDIADLRDAFAGVVETMENHSMPPGNSDQPTDAERKLVTRWMRKSLNLKPGYFDRIARYVVEPYEDKQGNLWFGTMNKGAARYNGGELKWFTKEQGLPSNTVPSFAEDQAGNLWVGTHEGVARFNGTQFLKAGAIQGLPEPAPGTPAAWSGVNADRHGNIWASVDQRVFRYNGFSFSEFKLPIDKSRIKSYGIVPGRASMMLHDKQDNFWFGTDGDGAYKFDGNTFTHLTRKDGLPSNNITSIIEDRNGNIWFTCMQSFQPEMTGDGGVCRWDGKTFTDFPKMAGLSKNDIYTIFETKSGEIWIGATGVGAYRYDGESFKLFRETDRKHWTRNFGVQGIAEDRNGTLWFGFSGGLFRFNGKSFYNITPKGPWR